MKNHFLFICVSILFSFLLLFLLELFKSREIYSFSLYFYEKPFEFCRIFLNHQFQEKYYGGFTNWAAYIFSISFGGLFLIGGFSHPITYYFFKYVIKSETIANSISKENLKYFLFIFIYGISIVFLYNFLVHIISSIYFDEKYYNCSEIIKWVESNWIEGIDYNTNNEKK